MKKLLSDARFSSREFNLNPVVGRGEVYGQHKLTLV
ncbi:hypothetical protein SAMN05720354_11275 [Nitrosospira sp. Nsp1]|nr:hypothetical protein SAMN05720354_11275 [Nitrosospira sp. Nsp1]